MNESVFFGHIAIFSMVLTSQHLLLLLKVGVFARKAKQVQVENRILFGQLDHLVRDSCSIIGAEGLQGNLHLLILVFLLLNRELILSHFLTQSRLLLLEVALNAHAILVQLVLSQEVATDALV